MVIYFVERLLEVVMSLVMTSLDPFKRVRHLLCELLYYMI